MNRTALRHSVIFPTIACLAGLLVPALLPWEAANGAADPPEAKFATGAASVPGEGFTCLGRIRPRHAREIQSSNWSVGAETMDRAKQEAKAEADRIVAAAKAEIEQEVARAKESLRNSVAELAVAGASKILKREVDAKAHAELLRDIQKQL